MAGNAAANNMNNPNNEPQSNIDVEVIFFNVIKNWWMILIACLIAAMAAYVFVSERYTPSYYAEATLVVSSKDGGSDVVYSNLVVAEKLAESLSYVLESPVLQQKVAESLEMPGFYGKVTALSIDNTNLIDFWKDFLN